MAVTAKPTPDALAPYIVTRALCMGGERVEVGSIINLSRVQATDMMSANKVAPAPAEAPAPKPAKAKAAAPAAASGPVEPAEPAAPSLLPAE